jgi:3-deoxy-7-phosphoheptulonate synthase
MDKRPWPAECVLILEDASERDVGEIETVARELSPAVYVAQGDGWSAVSVGDGTRPLDVGRLRGLPSVARVAVVGTPYRLASREALGRGSTVRIEIGRDPIGPPLSIGDAEPLVLMARASVSDLADDLLQAFAEELHDAGTRLLLVGQLVSTRAPGDQPAIDLSGLARVHGICAQRGVGVCVEVDDARQCPEAARLVEVLQVGSRNMQDFNLLRELGKVDRPVLLKRGFGATVEEFLLGAEYVLAHGNGRVILCESGIRTFDALWRPRFEINAVPVIKMTTHLPLMADPSTSADSAVVPSIARAAIAAGADGLVVDVDGGGVASRAEGTLEVSDISTLVDHLEPIARAVGRQMEVVHG